VNPVPGSLYHNPQTTIILNNGSLLNKHSVDDKNLVEIHGSSSGKHSWSARLSDDEKTVIIKPVPAFDYGETVSVTVYSLLRKVSGESVAGTSFTFGIRNEITPELRARYNEADREIYKNTYGYYPIEKNQEKITYPLDSMPTYTITVNNNPAPGRIFYSNHEDQVGDEPETNSFPTIIDNDGTIFWARDVGRGGTDFKLNSNGYLTHYSTITDTPYWLVLDSNYFAFDSLQCQNGYEIETESHDMMMYPDGHALVMAHDKQTIDMTPYGGIPDATVQGLVLQELDANRDVVFEWRSWDHFLFTDANIWTPLTNAIVDYVHANSIERDFDGNLLLSSRNMDELTKINRSTGDIIWRMGGENNQFTFVNDNIPAHFSSQHDLRRIPNGNITVFNNGNHLTPLRSSAKEYALDEVNKIATLVWYYEHPLVDGFELFGAATGNAQRLPNGNTMINWGLIGTYDGLPNFTEVDANKNIVWEMSFDSAGQKSYRVHKYEWNPCSRVSGFTMKANPKPLKTTLSWGIATGAKSYKVRYRKLGASSWTTVKAEKAKFQLTSLSPGTAYEWKVKTVCSNSPNVTSPYSIPDTFTTPPLKLIETESLAGELFSLYPVPATDKLSIALNEPGYYSLRVVSLLGIRMYESGFLLQENGAVELDVRQWSAGIYLIECSNGFRTEVKKIEKQ
jgi:hypothetical protein